MISQKYEFTKFVDNPDEGLFPEEDMPLTPLDGLSYDQNSRFSNRYTAEDGTIAEDLEILDEVLVHCALVIRDLTQIFLADNRDFTNLLTGDNLQRFAWIHPGHPTINEGGELTDRWGTPLFFHRESGTKTSLRSAGRDLVMWTDDDVESEQQGQVD